MERFEYPYRDADAGKVIDSDGGTFVVSGRLLRQVAREIAPQLDMEELAGVLHKAADLEWAHAGSNFKRKKLVSEVHELAAKLQGISAQLHELCAR